LSASTQQTSAASQQVAAASNDLQRLADKLQSLVKNSENGQASDDNSISTPGGHTEVRKPVLSTVYHAVERSKTAEQPPSNGPNRLIQ